MKNVNVVASLAALALVAACGSAMAAEYRITWKNELPAPGNQNACKRKITGIPVVGVGTTIKDYSALRFPLVGEQVLRETVAYSPALGCAKIQLDVACAYKDGDVTEFTARTFVNPCRDTTAKIKLYKLETQ